MRFLWRDDNVSAVTSGRRKSRRRLHECLPEAKCAQLSLQEHYNQITLQNPLALLPVLRKRKLATDRAQEPRKKPSLSRNMHCVLPV